MTRRRKRRLSARLITPVQVLAPSVSSGGSWADEDEEWTSLIDETRGEIWGHKGAEGEQHMADAERITHHMRLRYHHGVNGSCRIKNLVDSTEYEIVYITNIDYKNRVIIMDLKQV